MVLHAPEDQAICLFAGLLANPDMPLSLKVLFGASNYEESLDINYEERSDDERMCSTDSSEETEEESVLMQASIEQYDLFYSVY